MMLFEDTQKTMTDLLLEIKRNANLQKQVTQRDIASSIGSLLSTITIGAILLLLAGIALLLLCIGLAHLIGNATDSMTTGYACTALLVVVLLCVIYANRNRWIKHPIMRLVNNSIGKTASDASTDELRRQLNESRRQIGRHIQQLKSPASTPINRFGRFTQWASWGISAYKGYRLGASLFNSIGSLFSNKKKGK